MSRFFSFTLAVVWRNVAFKYMFQFITSPGFLLIGFYYVLGAGVSRKWGCRHSHYAGWISGDHHWP